MLIDFAFLFQEKMKKLGDAGLVWSLEKNIENGQITNLIDMIMIAYFSIFPLELNTLIFCIKCWSVNAILHSVCEHVNCLYPLPKGTNDAFVHR